MYSTPEGGGIGEMRKMKGENRNNEAGDHKEYCKECNAITSVLMSACTTDEFASMVTTSPEADEKGLCFDCYEAVLKAELKDAEDELEEAQNKFDHIKEVVEAVEREGERNLPYQ